VDSRDDPSNQIFFVMKVAGTKAGRVCVRALLQLPKPPSGYVTVAETNPGNNSICV
jgi:hypothetical protein